jgi:hypothetical protein
MEHTNETKKGNFIVRTYRDENPESPRTDRDNFGKMIIFSRSLTGDKHDYKFDDYNSWNEMKEDIIEKENVGVILPLYKYEHGGITISTSPFSCTFDSGQVGWTFCTKEEMESNFITHSGQDNEERSEVILKGEVETFNQYLQGDIFGYKVFQVQTCDKGYTHEEELDSCWGYYGEDECMTEGLSVMKWFEQHEKEKELVSE